MGFPLNEMNLGEHHHRPGPHRPRHHWNDTECAVEIPPWEDCCGEGDDCLCLTSADTSAWDDVVNTVNTYSGTWGGGEPEPGPETSAAIWNETFEAVSTNSASWGDTTVANNSAQWNEVSAALKTVFTKLPIVGDGTIKNPIGLDATSAKYWNDSSEIARFLLSELYKIDGKTPEWATIYDLDELWNNVSALTSAWRKNELDDVRQWDAISRLSKGESVETYTFKYAPEMTPENASQYSETNVIYYTDKW